MTFQAILLFVFADSAIQYGWVKLEWVIGPVTLTDTQHNYNVGINRFSDRKRAETLSHESVALYI